MQLQFFAFAGALLFAGQAVAQCGTNQLTTPPLFVANNSGTRGGGIYFSLTADAGAANGISICSIDVNTGVAAGSAINAVVYRHNTITDWNQLTSLNPADWCQVTTAAGISNGLGIGSTLNLAALLDIAPGSQGLFVIEALDFNQAYTNGNGTNQTTTDGNLLFDGGLASNVALSGAFFNPRVANCAFRYNLPAAPVGNTPCIVLPRCVPVGQGCGGTAAQVYELFTAFDLADPAAGTSEDVSFLLAGNTITTVTGPGSPIIPPTAPDLGLGDDENTALIALGFTIDGICADSISVASNGYIWLGALGTADFSPTEAEFVGQGARIAGFWQDLNPAAGGTIHVDTNPNQCLVTYLAVFPFGGIAPAVTMQIEITPNAILVRYDPNGGSFAGAPIVGLTNGEVPTAPPGGVDLNGGAVPNVLGSASLTLACSNGPVLGGSATFAARGFPLGGVGGIIASFGAPLNPAIPLAPLTPVGCEQYVLPAFTPLALFFGQCQGSFTLTVPLNPAFFGTRLTFQAASLGNVIVTSNGIDVTIG